MDEKISDCLKNIGYEGPLLQRGNLKTSIEYGSKNIEYTKLVHYLTDNLRKLCSIDEQVNPITSPEDSSTFVLEISSFLKELNCPYKSLTQGHLSERLQNKDDRELLLDYLLTELMAARILHEKSPEKKMELKIQETPEAADLKQILITLGFPKPPADITIKTLFSKLTPTVESLVKKAGDELVGKPFFTGVLSEKQWQALDDLQRDLDNDYRIRRQMLLTRLDVTVQSFKWSERTKGKDDYLQEIYQEKRNLLNPNPNVTIPHLLAARSDIAIIEKTSSSSVRKNTSTSIHKVIIGQVPDRGGRTNELAPPPPEMPSWQQRTPGPPGGGRGGYGRGGQQNYSRGGGQQNYSRGGGNQSDYGRGNNRFGNSSNRGSHDSPSNVYSGFKSSMSSLSSSQKPFSNFDTSLSSYSSSSLSNYSSTFRPGGSTSSFSTYSRENRNSDRGSSFSESTRDRGSASRPFDSAGSYDSPNKRPRSSYSTNKDYDKSTSDSYSNQKRSFDIPGDKEDRGNYGSRTSNYGGDSHSNYNKPFDSAGSYDANNKRPKSYDNYQTNKSTYSEQYVKDAQSNHQYNSRNESTRARGRSNYHRGRGRDNSYR